MRCTHYNICIIKRWQLHLTGNACELQEIRVFQSRTYIFQIHSLRFPTSEWLFIDINMLLSVANITVLHISHCIFKNSLFLYIINYSSCSNIFKKETADIDYIYILYYLKNSLMESQFTSCITLKRVQLFSLIF